MFLCVMTSENLQTMPSIKLQAQKKPSIFRWFRRDLYRLVSFVRLDVPCLERKVASFQKNEQIRGKALLLPLL